MPKKIHHPHDKGYKSLLSSQDIFLQLLQCFIDKEWVKNIDEESITPMDKSFIMKDFTEKEADLVYQLKIQDQEVIFYILMELQSSVDFQMPYRLLMYMIGIWQEIIKDTFKKELARKDFRLPVIIPIVLYNGEGNWTAPLSFKESLAGYQLFEDYLLDFKYFLLDVKRYKEEELLELANLIGTVFLVDQKRRDISNLINIIGKLGKNLKEMPASHTNLFFRWIKYVLPKPLPNELLEEMENVNPEEVETMISNLGKSIEDALRKAELKGEKKGKREGKLEGRLEGRLEGEKETLVRVVKNMLKMGVEEEIIAQMTGLPLEEIRQIRAKS